MPPETLEQSSTKQQVFDPNIPVHESSDGTERQVLDTYRVGAYTCHRVVEKSPEGIVDHQQVFTMFDSQVGPVVVPKEKVIFKHPEPVRNLPA